MLLLIDNYDSFTYNLVHYLGELGADVVVKRNDALRGAGRDRDAARGHRPLPRPLRPRRRRDLPAADQGRRRPPASRCSASALATRRSARPSAARSSAATRSCTARWAPCTTPGKGVFRGLPSPFQATRYHSLVVERDTPARRPRGHRLAGGRHDHGPAPPHHLIEGVQFHPEIIASEHGHQLLRNFLDEARAKVPA